MEEHKKKKLTGVRIASLWFNHNDQNTYNSMKATEAFLKKATAQAKKEGYTNVRVRPGYREGDENNLESYYLYVIGDRMETDEEFKKRMHGEFIRERERRKMNKLEHDYFESDRGKANLAELEKLSK